MWAHLTSEVLPHADDDNTNKMEQTAACLALAGGGGDNDVNVCKRMESLVPDF